MNIIGTNKNDTLTGGSGDDQIFGKNGNDSLVGEGGNDSLVGGSGNDILNGGSGTNILKGGIGNDLYIISSTTDVIVDNLNEGFDRVESSVSYTLSDNLENLTLIGSSNIYGQGNALNNRIVGNDGNNSLHDGAGNDTLYGGGGRDYLTSVGGEDYLNGGIGDDSLIDYDHYFGSDRSSDTLVGGLGNDSYEIPMQYLGTITENVNAGIDRVLAHGSGSYTLGNNLENLFILELNGKPIIQNAIGIGNALNNIITNRVNYYTYSLFGEAGDDSLISNSQNDSLYGGIGKDTLDGKAGNDYLYGNDGNDSLFGGNGNDFLVGNLGNDTLTGGSDGNTFVFNSPLEGIDSITDFNHSEEDKIQVSISRFGIGENRYDKFTFSTDVLYFDQIALASLQSSSGFDITRDITFI